jgi:glucose/mannose-6-phosphate isomerase
VTDRDLDTLGMWGAARALPSQLVTAAGSVGGVDGLPPAEGISAVCVMGMGGSGIAGDVTAAIAGPRSPVPVVVSKSYVCPAWVGPDTLVIAVSFSGDTEETLEAAHAAVGAGARLVAVTTGGRLASLAREWGAPVVPVDATIPMPRAAIGAVSVPPLLVMERLGLLEGVPSHLDAAIDQVARRVAELEADDRPVRDIARRIGRTIPLVYGAGPIGEVAAWRWKGQFNENPKVPSFANRVPELTHNEVCGWAQHGDVTRQVFTLVQLRHGHERPGDARRLEYVAELYDEVVGDVIVVESAGEGDLAQLFDLVLLGDLVSLRMAADAGVDPGPVPVLDELKAWMRRS